MFDRKAHWERIYHDRKAEEVSWYQSRPDYSLELIKATGIKTDARIIDIGAGASTLVDYLQTEGYQNLTVLDIAKSAIEQAKTRLGDSGNNITWLEHDITDPDITDLTAHGHYDLWHDRAVFHFLTDANDRRTYVNTLDRALNPHAHVIIASFGLDGPEKCSGLEIVRYSPKTMAAVLGNKFKLVEARREQHTTPTGSLQNFVYCWFVKI